MSTCNTDCTELVAIPGPRGLRGEGGTDGSDGINAFTVTTAAFEMPAEGDDVPVFVEENGWAGVGQLIFITNAGTFRVVSKTGTTEFLLLNVADSGTGAYAENATPGIEISSGQQVSPAGESGVTGTGGDDGIDGTDGVNAFTVTTANFTQPAEGATVAVEVATSLWAAQGQYVFVEGGGTYQVVGIPDATHLTLENLEDTASGLYPDNAAPTTVIGAGAQVTPAGQQGPTGTAGSSATIVNYFRVHKNGVAQAQPDVGVAPVGVLVTFSTAAFNNGSVFNVGTGIWTCPATGIYQFGFHILYDMLTVIALSDLETQMWLNGGPGVGTMVARTTQDAENDDVTSPLNTILSLTAGETIQLYSVGYLNGNTYQIGGAATDTWFCGFRLA